MTIKATELVGRSPFYDAPEEVGLSLGSGVIIDPAGYIVTNNHVIAGGHDIRVAFADGNEVPAKVVGRDAELDIGLIKVDGKDLVAAALGDSDHLEVGDWVLAIGNPFGLSHTATAGIVSAVGRTTRDVPIGKPSRFQSFIQTDASINPGNSGGPLVNTSGEVVGIATAIDTRGQGIGFAVPINLVKDVVPALRRDGRLARTWLGVYLSPLTDDLAASVALPARGGVFVSGVVPGSPAARAGIGKGDVILEFDGKKVDDKTLPWRVAVAGAGRKVTVKIWRAKAEKKLDVVMERLPG
ncbi:MAG TPA: trypsin-like peptidase domain-containing protein [Solirubrobacteraceae bacterium]